MVNEQIKLRAIPNYGDVMTIKDFRESVETGLFVNDDGDGNYATSATEMTNIRVDCRERGKHLREDFPYVVWFNK